MEGPEFDTEQRKVMLVVRLLYGLKSSGVDFRDSLSEQLHGLYYRPLIVDPDVWMRPEVKQGGFMHYECVLNYVDGVLCISDDPI